MHPFPFDKRNSKEFTEDPIKYGSIWTELEHEQIGASIKNAKEQLTINPFKVIIWKIALQVYQACEN
jgi:hypothetical protein